MRRLLLVRHASTEAVRSSAFGADEPLDSHGRSEAARLSLPRSDEVLVSPALRARETASCAGLVASGEAPAECDFGRWAGLSLREVAEREPDAVREWMTDPDAAPHGGESLTQLLARVADWLGAQATLSGSAVAITHGGVVKACVVVALAAPPSAFWRIDVAPLAATELHAHDGRWTVTKVNVAAAGHGDLGELRQVRGAGAISRDAAGSRDAAAPRDQVRSPRGAERS
jgi:broad specificity phosphatase PhoE